MSQDWGVRRGDPLFEEFPVRDEFVPRRTGGELSDVPGLPPGAKHARRHGWSVDANPTRL